MKKIGLSLVALALALVIPFSSVDAAGNGSWEEVGIRYFYYNSTYDWYYTHIVYSTGGDFKVSTNNSPFTVYLYEYDPGPGNDDYVGSANFDYPGDSIYFRDINRFVDGSNNKAEFYLRTYYYPGDEEYDFYD